MTAAQLALVFEAPVAVVVDAEVWLPVGGFETKYAVSSHGRVWSWFGKGRYLKPARTGSGHPRVQLQSRSAYVHTLVAFAFIGPRPAGLEVCHGDGEQTNNHVGNLRYDTHQANMQDAIEHGRVRRGREHHNAKLTKHDIPEIRRRSAAGETSEAIGQSFGVTGSNILQIRRGNSWAWVA